MEDITSKYRTLQTRAKALLSRLSGDVPDSASGQHQHEQPDKAGGAAGCGGTSSDSGTPAVNAWTLRSKMMAAFEAADSAMSKLQRGEVVAPVEVATLLVSAGDALLTLAEHIVLQGEEIRKLKDELQSLKEDQAMLLLRQMATQAVNKVARVAMPGLTAWDVRDIKMKAIPKLGDAAKYNDIMVRYPQFKAAVYCLCDAGRPVAHPVPNPPVTEEQLQALIMQHLGKPLRNPAHEALKCLVELSQQLKEDLFVSTEKQEAA